MKLSSWNAGAKGKDKDGKDKDWEDRKPRASIVDMLSERLDMDSQLQGNLWKKDTAGSDSWKMVCGGRDRVAAAALACF